jgi:hypothetical protein
MNSSAILPMMAEGWCDAQLQGWRWDESGRDLIIKMIFPAKAGNIFNSREFRCRWARAVKIRIAFGESQGGYPVAWDAQFERSESAINVLLDFGSTGEIRLECSEIEWIDLENA